MTNVPCLFITYNRLEYTKKALAALLTSDVTEIFIWDNASTDGTKEYLLTLFEPKIQDIHFSLTNMGIRTAMNWFLGWTTGYDFVAKVDNDTIIPADFCARMLPHMTSVDLVQAKHHIIEATCLGGWDNFVKPFKKVGNLYFGHFIGGSGVLLRRNVLTDLPHTNWVLYSWRTWQASHPHVTRAFAADVEITLLDEHGYEDYPVYYKETGRATGRLQ